MRYFRTFLAILILFSTFSFGQGTQFDRINARGSITTPDLITSSTPVDVRSKGAVGDGSTDNCTALTAAFAACSNGTILIPNASAAFQTSCALVLPNTCDLRLDGILQAKSAVTALVETVTGGSGNGFYDRKSIYGHGKFDGNFLATHILWLRQYRQTTLEDFNISGIALNGDGIHLGDPGGGSAGGYGAQIFNVQWGPHSAGTQTGSSCVYVDTGVGDTQMVHGTPHGCATGIYDTVGGSRYIDLHAWDQAMTVCFDDLGNGTFWTANQCDGPSTYGFHLHGFNTHIISSRMFQGANDNLAVAFQFDQADPHIMMVDNYVIGTDASHRWQKDTNLSTGSLTSQDTVIGTQTSNVATFNFGAGTLVTSLVSQLAMQARGSFQTGKSANTDVTGRITLSGGSGSFSLASGPYTSAPDCTCADTTTPANSCSVSESTTTLTFTGTGTDIVKYICVGRN